MSSGNCVRNTTLTEMLAQQQKAQRERSQNAMTLRHTQPAQQERVPPIPERRVPIVEDKKPGRTTDAPPRDLNALRTEAVSLTLDEIEWLDEVVARHGFEGMSSVFKHLVDWANAEPAAAKKQLFLVVRCRRCSAGAKGGVKRDHPLALPARQWQWLQNVQERCKHVSVGKTLRILVDFYMPLCKEDHDFERRLLQLESTPKGKNAEVSNSLHEKHDDAAVDPARGEAAGGA